VPRHQRKEYESQRAPDEALIKEGKEGVKTSCLYARVCLRRLRKILEELAAEMAGTISIESFDLRGGDI
jgi:hypothetical protein